MQGLTVRGITFTRGDDSLDGCRVYHNGKTRVIHDQSGDTYQAQSWVKWSSWCDTPKEALEELARFATPWAKVLSELSRLGIKTEAGERKEGEL